MELIEYQKRVFRAVPGGKTGTLSGHISARRGALPMYLMWPPNSDHNFGQAPPSMESIAALASSTVAYLPNSLYLAFWVEGSSLPGMTRHCLVVLSSTR